MTEAPYLLTLNVRPSNHWVYGGAEYLASIWPIANRVGPRDHDSCFPPTLARGRQHDFLCGLVSAGCSRHNLHGDRLP